MIRNIIMIQENIDQLERRLRMSGIMDSIHSINDQMPNSFKNMMDRGFNLLMEYISNGCIDDRMISNWDETYSQEMMDLYSPVTDDYGYDMNIRAKTYSDILKCIRVIVAIITDVEHLAAMNKLYGLIIESTHKLYLEDRSYLSISKDTLQYSISFLI